MPLPPPPIPPKRPSLKNNRHEVKKTSTMKTMAMSDVNYTTSHIDREQRFESNISKYSEISAGNLTAISNRFEHSTTMHVPEQSLKKTTVFHSYFLENSKNFLNFQKRFNQFGESPMGTI